MVRTSRAFAIGALVSSIVAFLAFVGGLTVGQSAAAAPLFAGITSGGAPQRATPASVADKFAVFWEVWDLIDRDFYRTHELDYQKMTYGAINGMLASLGDDYTRFEEPEAAAKTQENMSGRFEGIGAYIEYKDNKLLIVSPIEESPAEKAGIQAGDQVVKVNGQELAPQLDGLDPGAASTKAAELIRGPKGTAVDLTIFRASTNETIEFSIVRDSVPLVSVRSKLLDNRIGYIQLTQFKATTTQELDNALNELLPQQPRGIILDLRNNPGGYLNSAQETLGRFLPDGVALHEQFGNGTRQTLEVSRTANAPKAFDIPLVVLTNNGSASAAEIVAGALLDRERATLVGEKTFGKGSVQAVRELSDGSSARITIAQWLTPNNIEINKRGIEPNVYVPFVGDQQYNVKLPQSRPIDPAEVNDSQLWWAIKLLTSDERPAFPTPTPTAGVDTTRVPTATIAPTITPTP